MVRAHVYLAGAAALGWVVVGIVGGALAALGSTHSEPGFATRAVLMVAIGGGIVPAAFAIILAANWWGNRSARGWLIAAVAGGLLAAALAAGFLPLLMLSLVPVILLVAAAFLQARSKVGPSLAHRGAPRERPEH